MLWQCDVPSTQQVKRSSLRENWSFCQPQMYMELLASTTMDSMSLTQLYLQRGRGALEECTVARIKVFYLLQLFALLSDDKEELRANGLALSGRKSDLIGTEYSFFFSSFFSLLLKFYCTQIYGVFFSYCNMSVPSLSKRAYINTQK